MITASISKQTIGYKIPLRPLARTNWEMSGTLFQYFIFMFCGKNVRQNKPYEPFQGFLGANLTNLCLCEIQRKMMKFHVFDLFA